MSAPRSKTRAFASRALSSGVRAAPSVDSCAHAGAATSVSAPSTHTARRARARISEALPRECLSGCIIGCAKFSGNRLSIGCLCAMELWQTCEIIRIFSRSATAGGNRLIDVFHVGIKAAKLTLAFDPALAQCGDGARLDHLEKVEPRRAADVLVLLGIQPFEPGLRRRNICTGVGEVAIAAGQLQ